MTEVDQVAGLEGGHAAAGGDADGVAAAAGDLVLLLGAAWQIDADLVVGVDRQAGAVEASGARAAAGAERWVTDLEAAAGWTETALDVT